MPRGNAAGQTNVECFQTGLYTNGSIFVGNCHLLIVTDSRFSVANIKVPDRGGHLPELDRLLDDGVQGRIGLPALDFLGCLPEDSLDAFLQII